MALYKMFNLIKKVVILDLMSVSSVLTSKNCLLPKNQECKRRKIITDNDYMTFPYKIKVDKGVGSCNNVENPYFKICGPDIVKNGSVKVLDLISRKNVLRNLSFHKSFKCSCLLDEKVCNNKQKWNKEKCRCECLEIKERENGSFWNVVNCRCEFKKVAKLIVEEEECDIETDDIVQNKTITLIKKNWKPFVASSILFVCVSVILTGIMTYFYCKSRNKNVLPY